MNDGVITEKRTRFVCTIGSSSDPHIPQIKSDAVTYRACNNKDGIDCQETGELYQLILSSNKKLDFS
jgi:hypothetical protein